MIDERSVLPDLRDGLTREERIIVYCLQQTQAEIGSRNVPTLMLYGRVVELIDIGEDEFQTVFSRMIGVG